MFIVYIRKSLTSYPKETAITVIRKPKSNSSFRSPYLSKRRNENVSMAVMRTPSQRGILKEIKYMVIWIKS